MVSPVSCGTGFGAGAGTGEAMARARTKERRVSVIFILEDVLFVDTCVIKDG